MQQNILIRCDASKEIGLGHLSRCLVLAKGFRQKNHKVFFAIRENSLAIQIIKDKGFEFFLPSSTDYDQWLQKEVDINNISIFIGDVRDNLPPRTIQNFQKKGILCIAVDEPSEYAKECDICFYPPHTKIESHEYKGKVYQGFEYVILRDQFYKTHKKHYHNKPNLLVMMGGTDTYNLSFTIIQQLLLKKIDTNISLIINKNHQDFLQLSNIAPSVKLHSNIQDMATFLTQIDFAIITFGVSAYELVAMGIPAYHICLDDDHYNASDFFEKNGYAKRIKKTDIKTLESLPLLSFEKKAIPNLIIQTILSEI